MNFKIAIQLYTLRDNMAESVEDTLRAVKEMGYDGVEFAGLFGKTGAEIKALCDKYDLIPISAHVNFLDVIADPTLLDTYAEIGCRFVVVPYLKEENRPGTPGFAQVLEGIKFMGQRAAELGLQIGYHNHDFEFVKLGDEYALDLIFRENPDLQTELDTCWVKVGGEDPAAYVTKYAGRVTLLHLKDFVGQKARNMYNLIGLDDHEEKKADAQEFEFRPVGMGVQDFPAILAAAEKAGTEWVIVEQDRPSLGLTPMQCARASITYLKGL